MNSNIPEFWWKSFRNLQPTKAWKHFSGKKNTAHSEAALIGSHFHITLIQLKRSFPYFSLDLLSSKAINITSFNVDFLAVEFYSWYASTRSQTTFNLLDVSHILRMTEYCWELNSFLSLENEPHVRTCEILGAHCEER